MGNFTVTDKVSYTETSRGRKIVRTGEVIEVNDITTRVRIKWDNGAPRTWIRVKALVNLTTTKL